VREEVAPVTASTTPETKWDGFISYWHGDNTVRGFAVLRITPHFT